MDQVARKVRGVLAIGLTWGLVWGTLFAVTALIIGILDPPSMDPGESPVGGGAIGLAFGFLSGVSFGVILSFAENRKPVIDLGLLRVAIWGALGSAALPLLTTMNNSLMIVSCPLGALCAAASVAIARRAKRHGAEWPPLLKWLGRFCANPLQAVCASSG